MIKKNEGRKFIEKKKAKKKEFGLFLKRRYTTNTMMQYLSFL